MAGILQSGQGSSEKVESNQVNIVQIAPEDKFGLVWLGNRENYER